MRWKKAGIAATTAAMLSITACGGGGETDPENTEAGGTNNASPTFKEGGDAGGAIDMTRSKGPAPK